MASLSAQDAPGTAAQSSSSHAASRLSPSDQTRLNELRASGFSLHQEGKVVEAIQVFREVHSLAPDDCSVDLQIGYWYYELKDLPQAGQWFQRAASCSDPATAATAQRAMNEVARARVAEFKSEGFRRKGAGDVRGAVAEFERVLEVDPADYTAMLQIGYWYADLHEPKQADAWFQKALLSPDPQEAQAAKKARENLAPLLRPYFVSTYMSPLFDSRFSDFIFYTQTKVGLKLGPSAWRIEPYLSFRLLEDTRSGGGALPRIFSDNVAVPAVGVQIHPLTPYADVFFEAGNGVSLLSHPPPDRGRAIPDYRGGILYFRGWGTDLGTGRPAPRGFLTKSGFREVYLDTEYYSRFGDNVIGYLQYKEGFKTQPSGPLNTQVFAITNLAKDSKSDYYNNVFEIGPGLRTAWRRHPNINFYLEFVHGVYLTEGRRTRNIGGPNFNDVRVFFTYQAYF